MMVKTKKPEGWEEKRLGDYIKLQGGYAFKSDAYREAGVPLIRISNITQEGLTLENMVYLDYKILRNFPEFSLSEGDTIIAMSGATTGKSCSLRSNDIPALLNQRVGRFNIKSIKVVKDFVKYLVQDERFKIEIFKDAIGGAQPNISSPNIEKIKVSFPPKLEQQKISKILLTIDDAIGKTKELIEKNKRIKQGAMRDLFTRGIDGRTPMLHQLNYKKYHIPGNWSVKNIGKTSTLKGRIGWQGLTTEEYLESGEFILITGTDFKKGKINWETCAYVSADRYIQDTNIQVKEEDILITKDGTIGKIAFLDRLPKAATLNSGIFVLRPKNEEYVPGFMYHLLSSFFFDDFIENLKAGSTIAHLYQKDFIKFEFPLPDKKEEQAHIIKILSSIDNKIKSEENYLNKLTEMKAGLMQDLLTGLVRVKVGAS